MRRGFPGSSVAGCINGPECGAKSWYFQLLLRRDAGKGFFKGISFGAAREKGCGRWWGKPLCLSVGGEMESVSQLPCLDHKEEPKQRRKWYF